MSLEYNVRYPLTGKITEWDIKNAAREWIEESRWYQFTETNFPAEEKEGTLIQVGAGRTAWFKHFEYRDKKGPTETYYYGYRLETTDSENRKWRAEAVFELGKDAAWMYVNNACYINDLLLPVKMKGGSRYPRIIRVLLEKGLVADDHGFTIGQPHTVSDLSEEEIEKLRNLMKNQTRLELPILCMHVHGGEEWTDMMRTMTAEYLSRTIHVFICMSEEDEKLWNDILKSGEWIEEEISGKALELPEANGTTMDMILPQSSIFRRLFSKEIVSDSKLVDLVMDNIETLRPFQPADSPNWNWLHLQNTILPSDAEGESYNLIMNETLAARLQEARKQHHLTQGDLAKKTGTTTILISRLERLQTKKVKRELIHDIEKALGLEKNELARLGTKKQEHTQKTPENPIATPIERDFLPEYSQMVHGSIFDNNESARFCHMCGTPLKENSRFCHNCGTRIQ